MNYINKYCVQSVSAQPQVLIFYLWNGLDWTGLDTLFFRSFTIKYMLKYQDPSDNSRDAEALVGQGGEQESKGTC